MSFIFDFHNRLTIRDIIFIISIAPLIWLAQHYGKNILEKMSDQNAKLISVTLSLLGIILLTQKYFL